MMKHVMSGALALAVITSAPVVALAQERLPNTGTTAVGIDFGYLVPSDDQLDTTMNVGAMFEYYLTPRVSLRTGFGISDSELAANEVNSLRQVPLGMDINYNWEGGRWHPFVGTGVGAYFLQQKSDGRPFGDQETKFGFNLGGGAEYFIGRRLALKGEGRYHFIEDAASGFDPSGLTLSVGLKRYF
jgi:opacity protein-like surface antigen